MDGTKDLLTLGGLCGSLESANLFNETYELALKRAKKQGDFEQIRQLKRILDAQCLFMFSQYLREEAKLKDIEERGEIQ
jgi:hypothetical protein